jgi:aspartyl-tRNA(Asn)/glutamyl-tRNA(Gln) amidotransferase subunit C
MAISKDDVKYIANLARVGLTDAEVGHFQAQLEGILDYIDKLKKLDCSGVKPTAHAADIKNVYRPDMVKPSLPPEKILKDAPARAGNFFKVPKVIE